MSLSKRCPNCSGSGTILGTGMMRQDCKNCDGTGKLQPVVTFKEKAKRKIKEKFDVDDAEAEELFKKSQES